MRGTSHVVVFFLLASGMSWAGVVQNEDPGRNIIEIASIGKDPSSEIRFVGNYTDEAGKLHNVEIVRCWYCDEILSERHLGCEGSNSVFFVRHFHECHRRR